MSSFMTIWGGGKIGYERGVLKILKRENQYVICVLKYVV